MNDLPYAAEVMAHTPTGLLPVCSQHASKLVSFMRFVGVSVALGPLTAPAQCSNCVNEAKLKIGKL
jgi:hypothetical protein